MVTPDMFVLCGFLFGLLLGSFLNVCISRLPGHESVVRPGSHCRSCGHAVRWFDNVPVLSWVVLRGRCRDCGTGISWRYPAVELGVGIWFAIVAARALSLLGFYDLWRSIPTPPGAHPISALMGAFTKAGFVSLAEFAAFGFLLIGLMVMDWQTQRLPDAFTLTGIAIGFASACVQASLLPAGVGDIVLNTTYQLRLSSPGSSTAQGNVFLTGPEVVVMRCVAEIAGAALILLVVRWVYRAARKRDGMGLGDVKLLAMIAAFLGFGQSLLTLGIGVLTAAGYGVVLLAFRKAGKETKLPFGSFLAAGGLFAALFGAGLVDWYLGLLR
jgi:leader peptidase (prepilin peptidase) / N-methyltransferase